MTSPLRKTLGLVLLCFLAGLLGLYVGLQGLHAWNDHLVLHELARREALREAGQDPYAKLPPAVPPAPSPKK